MNVKKILILLSPLLIIVALVLVRKQDVHFGDSKLFEKWATQDVADWLKKDYALIDSRASLKSLLNQRQIEGASLTEEMRNAYWEDLLDFIYAHKDGNIESWKTFRFNSSISSNLTSNGIYQVKFYYGLIRKARTVPDYAPNDPAFLGKWAAFNKTRKPPIVNNDKDLELLFYSFLTEITYGNLYRDYFQGICLDEMIVKYNHYTTPPSSLDNYQFFPFRVQRGHAVDANFPNQGYSSWDNNNPALCFFQTHPTMSELLSENKYIDCMNTFVFIKINDKGKVAPFLLRHVWDAKTHHWLLAEMVDAHLSGGRNVSIIF